MSKKRRASGEGIVDGLLNGLEGVRTAPVASGPALPEQATLKTLPLHSDSSMKHRLFHAQRVEVEARASFVRGYVARGGVAADGQKLDPVLAFHLGLTQGK